MQGGDGLQVPAHPKSDLFLRVRVRVHAYHTSSYVANVCACMCARVNLCAVCVFLVFYWRSGN